MIHEMAVVDDFAIVGAGTNIWRWSHVRGGALIGRFCNIGERVYIDTGVKIGESCKIQNGANLYCGLTVGDRVFIGPNVQFTNDKHPRAVGDWSPVPTIVEDDASIGAGAVIVCGVTIGAGATVGAGAVVTRDVPRGATAVGNPARVVGLVRHEYMPVEQWEAGR